MNSVEILVGHRWQDDVRHIHSLRDRRPADTSLNLLELRDIVDIVIDGTNLTAPVSEEAIFGLVGNTLTSLVALLEERSRKAIVEFHHQPWELVLVPDGASLKLSLYSVDRRRRVVARNLPIEARSFIDAICEVAEEMLTGLFRISEHFSSNQQVRRISQALARLKRNRRLQFPPCSQPNDDDQTGVRVASTSTSGGLTLSYRYNGGDEALQRYRGEHLFDLHALLFDGILEAELGDEPLTLSEDYPFLAMTSLLDRTRQLFNQLESGDDAPFVLDERLAHLDLVVEGRGNHWILRAGAADGDHRAEWSAHPAECLDVLVSIAELFAQDLVRINESLEVNERFVDHRKEVQKLRHWHRDLCGNNVYHERPEDYLRRLGHLESADHDRPAPPELPWPLDSVHTLFERRVWSLRAERIDFSSLTLTSDDLLVSTPGEVRCLDQRDGQSRWTFELQTASDHDGSMIVTGDRLLAYGGDDRLQVLNRHTGRRETSVDLRDRWSRLIAAADYGPDGPTVAADRDGTVIGFDDDGQLQWRHCTGPGTIRDFVVDGPLVCIQSSEGVVTTLNPLTGETLWKIRLGGTPELAVRMHQGRLYTATRETLHDSSTLFALYPLTGRTVWQHRLAGYACGPPTFLDQWMIVPVERHGQIVLTGVDLEAIDPRTNWELELSSAGVDHPTPVLAVELEGQPHGLVRTDRAELTCFRISDGEVRWRSMPADETLLLHGNLPLFRIGEAVVNVSDTIDLRRLDTGELLHSLSAIEAPEFGFLAPPFRLLLGEQAPRGEAADHLTAFSVEHFLAVVE